MNVLIIYALSLALLIGLELLYFRVAERFQIIDKPNQRSSHAQPVIRGAGIIFPAAVLIWYSFFFSWPWFVCGMLLIAVVSFADDLKPVSSLWRATVHLFAVLLLFYQLSIFEWPLLLATAAFIISAGALSAFNFMDGINGITGLYALINMSTFLLINQLITPFTATSLLVLATTAVIVFLFFNLRKKARCFAGDVGSVTLAFLQIFFMFQLINATHQLLWVGVCVVFGVDAVLTILYRIKQKENIFKPHRQHVYQYLCNELKWSHTLVSFVYAGAQLIINLLLMHTYIEKQFWLAPVFIVIYSGGFFLMRNIVMRHVKPEVVRKN